MKGTAAFENRIMEHLKGLASKDSLFAEKLDNPNKNITDCVTYIFNQVQKSGCAGFDDSEIYGMAIHYYDEEDIDVGTNEIHGRVVVNYMADLSQEEIQQAKDVALQKVVREHEEKLTKKVKNKKSSETDQFEQPTLF